MSERGYVHVCDCGKKYHITRHPMPFGIRDSDSETCSCGREIKRSSGGYTFVVQEIEEEANDGRN